MYMTGDEIRALSRRIPEIVDATDEELSFWMDEAADVINNFCQQDFAFERQTTRQVRATTNTLVYLPKVLSGEVTVKDDEGGTVFSTISDSQNLINPVIFNDNDTVVSSTVGISTTGYAIEVFPGAHTLGYYSRNRQYRPANARILYVTGDWGFINSKEELLLHAINSLKSLYNSHRLSSAYHLAADTVNNILSADATDLATGLDLINELKAKINAHFGSTVSHTEADPNTATIDSAGDIDSAFLLAEDLKKKFNKHLLNRTVHIEQDRENTLVDNLDYLNAVMPRQIRRAFLRIVQRLSIRDNAEDIRQINSPYSQETLGDGYSYDISNGTLRSLLRPEEAHMLLPYVNRGRVII